MHTINPPTTTAKPKQIRGAAPSPGGSPDVLKGKGKGITTEIIDGVTYYAATRRGVEYTAYFSEAVGAWFVSTHRLALGRQHIGGGRYYKTIGELAQAVKAFVGLDLLIQEY